MVGDKTFLVPFATEDAHLNQNFVSNWRQNSPKPKFWTQPQTDSTICDRSIPETAREARVIFALCLKVQIFTFFIAIPSELDKHQTQHPDLLKLKNYSLLVLPGCDRTDLDDAEEARRK